jgi:hypothetical protein
MLTMSQPTESEARRKRHLILLTQGEGVSHADAEDFLAVLDAAEVEDPEFHARFMEELDRRILMRGAQADVVRQDQSIRALGRVASARDTRVGPGDVRRLVEAARLNGA